MQSSQIALAPSRRAAGRFIAKVRRKILEALVEEHAASGMTQSDIARVINVHRSVINRELRGRKDITLGRVAELAFALGRAPSFELVKPAMKLGSNMKPVGSLVRPSTSAAAVTLASPMKQLTTKAA